MHIPHFLQYLRDWNSSISFYLIVIMMIYRKNVSTSVA